LLTTSALRGKADAGILPVYQRAIGPESSLKGLFESYLRVMHPEKLVAVKALMARVRWSSSDERI
jgi:hypothetical protein